MGMQASAPAELRGAMGRPSYLSAGGPKAMFVVDAGCTMLQEDARTYLYAGCLTVALRRCH